jgi:hypothetical protein
MHECAAEVLKTGTPAAGYHGRIFESPEGTPFEVNDEAVEAIQRYADKIAEYRTVDNIGSLREMLVEVRVEFGEEIGQSDDDAFGTSDAIIFAYDLDELQVHDLKYGKGVRVFAERNTQAMLYGLGALRKVKLWWRPKHVRLVVHQPRLDHLDEWVISTDELEAWGRTEAAQRAAEALSALKGLTPPKLTPGIKQCKFCSARAECPASRDMAMGTAVEGFGDATDASNIKPREVPDDPTELGRLFLMLPFVEDWCRAVAGKVDKVAIEQGRDVPGLKVVIGKAGNRYWRDKDGAERVAGGYPREKTHTPPVPPQLKSPAQIEKVVGAAVYREHLAKFVAQEEGRKTVVPASDKRPAVSSNAAEGFDNVIEDGDDLA